jgi:iron(III) transport system permease protein
MALAQSFGTRIFPRRLVASYQRSGGQWPLVGITLLAGFLIVALLLVIIAVAFVDEIAYGSIGSFTLQNFRDLYSDPLFKDAMLNTGIFAAVTVATALLFAIPIAWLMERTDLPGRSLVFGLMALTLLVPGFFVAMGWQFLLHPRIGIINKWLVQLFPFEDAPINVGAVPLMGVLQGIGLVPLAFIMIAPGFRNMDPALEESAQVHGLGPVSRLRKITLPLMAPSIVAAAIYVFAIGFAAFDIPLFLGLGNNTFMLSTFLYIKTQPLDALPNYGVVGSVALSMMIFAFGLTWWYLRIIRQSHKYRVVTGKNYRPKRTRLGRWRFGAWAYILFLLSLALFIPLLTLVWASLLPFLMVPSRAAFELISLDNYTGIGWNGYWNGVRNSAFLVLATPTIAITVGIAISWVVTRSRIRGSWAFDLVAFLPHVIPNVIFAVGALLVGLFVVPAFVPFYGTVLIILLVYVVTTLPFATRMFNSAFTQIHRELDEAGHVSGLGPSMVMWKILRPLVAPTMLYAWLWVALLAYRELTMAALLTSRDNLTMPVFIWSVWSTGSLNEAAALGLLTFLVFSPLVVAYFLLGRRLLPWSD